MSSSDQVRTYSRAESVVFLKTDEPFGGLSNMAGGYPIRVNGIRILTSEALYQVCRFPHLPDVQRMIIGENSPMTAKMKSKPHRKNSRSDWDRVRVKVMRWCLRVKLAQNWAKFSELLLRTGDRPIVEESRRDDFWGAKPVDEQTLVGMNVLGRLLMELREAVKSQGRDALLSVAPLDIPEFLLFGRPIGTVVGPGQITPDAAAPPTAMAREVGRNEELAEQGSLFDAPAVREAPARTYAALPVSEESRLANLKPYPAMKESGVAWLGEVPEHWEVRRMKHLLRERDMRSSTGTEQLLRVSQFTGVTERRRADGGDEPDTRAESLVGYKLVEPEDLVVNIMLAWNGSMGVSRFSGIASPAYCVYRFSASSQPWYFHHLLRSPAYKARIKAVSTGVVESRLRLYSDDLYRLEGLLPPFPEQAAIVRFLDHADRRIRRYIRAKQKLIKLLEEQKQAIVHQAVTGRIDVRTGHPYPAYKDSGVEWLGEVPEHWKVIPLKRIAWFKSGSGFPVGEQGARGGEVPFLRVSDMNRMGNETWIETADSTVSRETARRLGAYVFPAGSIIFPKVGGALLTNKRRLLRMPSCIDNNVMGCVVQGGDLDYAFTLIQQLDLGRLAKPGPVPAIGEGDVREIKVALPSPEEQAAIVRAVRADTASLASAISSTQREIDLLHEYRTRLIADVVTGKLDVREAAARLPDEGDEPLHDAAEDESIPDEPADDLDALPEEAEA